MFSLDNSLPRTVGFSDRVQVALIVIVALGVVASLAGTLYLTQHYLAHYGIDTLNCVGSLDMKWVITLLAGGGVSAAAALTALFVDGRRRKGINATQAKVESIQEIEVPKKEVTPEEMKQQINEVINPTSFDSRVKFYRLAAEMKRAYPGLLGTPKFECVAKAAEVASELQKNNGDKKASLAMNSNGDPIQELLIIAQLADNGYTQIEIKVSDKIASQNLLSLQSIISKCYSGIKLTIK